MATVKAAPVKAPNPLDPAEIEVWIFDLDNTLYPADCRLFEQVDRRIGLFIADFLKVEPNEARRIQKQYFRDHGTTLSGLMANHGVDPEAFLEYVHDIDMSPVKPSESLPRLLDRLEGLKIIFTNGSAGHAERVMARLGVSDHFDAVFDIAAAAYVPKPRRETYRRLIDRHEIEPRSAVIIDDIAENLLPAAELGMTTVWIRSDLAWAQPGESDDHIHLVADDLVSWLESVIERS